MEKQPKEERGFSTEKTDTISKMGKHLMVYVVSLNEPNDFARENAVMEFDLFPGESKASGKMNNDRANLLFDTGAEIPICDVAFARKVGCQIDESELQKCIGIGESVYSTEGRTLIKATLNDNLVYVFKVLIGSMVVHDAILGVDFMVPAGI